MLTDDVLYREEILPIGVGVLKSIFRGELFLTLDLGARVVCGQSGDVSGFAYSAGQIQGYFGGRPVFTWDSLGG